MNYWLVKSEPTVYAWETLLKDKWTYWDGVRNYKARNNLKAMKKGDFVLYYHSNVGKAVVGIARVRTEHYADPTTKDDRWVVVDLEPVKTLNRPVTLEEIKNRKSLGDMVLVRNSRLSVQSVRKSEFETIRKMGMG